MTTIPDDPLDLDEVSTLRRHTGAYLEMLVSSLLSLTASLVLSVEAIRLAADPNATFTCDVSTVISCSKVAATWQASLLGFPNAYLGLIAEPVVITLAVAALGGVRFPRWFMLGAQAMYTVGFVFAWWLFVQAYVVIGALCPWCLLVTATTTLVFFTMTRINILDGHLRLPGSLHARAVRALELGLDTALAFVVLAVMAALVIGKYL